MNVFGIGLPEMVVIAAVGLLVFGPKRLPELGKTLGRTLRGFQSASQEFEKELRTAVAAPPETAADLTVEATVNPELTVLADLVADPAPLAGSTASPSSADGPRS
jgi:sec-independent protein translocase protein TatA